MKLHDAYFAAVDKIAWDAECKTVEAGLQAAAPAAAKLSEEMKAFERDTRSDTRCGDAIVAASNSDPRGKTTAKRFEAMLAAAPKADERCSQEITGWRKQFDGVVGAVGAAM